MAELVDATDLKSVGIYSRAGSIPAFRTTQKTPFIGCFFVKKAYKSTSHKIETSKILCLYLIYDFI